MILASSEANGGSKFDLETIWGGNTASGTVERSSRTEGDSLIVDRLVPRNPARACREIGSDSSIRSSIRGDMCMVEEGEPNVSHEIPSAASSNILASDGVGEPPSSLSISDVETGARDSCGDGLVVEDSS